MKRTYNCWVYWAVGCYQEEPPAESDTQLVTVRAESGDDAKNKAEMKVAKLHPDADTIEFVSFAKKKGKNHAS